MTDHEFDAWATASDDWERLRTYLRTLGDTPIAAGMVLEHMDGIKRRRAEDTERRAEQDMRRGCGRKPT